MKRIIFPALVILALNSFSQTNKKLVTDKIPGTVCNNVVDDKLTGAPNRSPSECEVQFELATREKLQLALSKLIREWAGTDWIVSDTVIAAPTGRSRESEKLFYDFPYYFKLDLNPASAAYKPWYEKYQAVMEEAKAKPGEESNRKMFDSFAKINGGTHINIYILVNSISTSMIFLKSGQHPFEVAGATYAVRGSHVAQLTGGGIEESRDAALIVFGKPKINAHKSGDNTMVIVEGVFPKGISHLTVQHITVRIECNDELLNTVLKQIDTRFLASMIGQ